MVGNRQQKRNKKESEYRFQIRFKYVHEQDSTDKKENFIGDVRPGLPESFDNR